MDGLKYDSGQYTISVAPKGVSGDATMQYYYTSHVDKLESPKNLVWIGDKAAWDAVDGATSYNVSLYDFSGRVVTIPTTSCLYDFSGSSPKDGWTFSVQALSDGTWSAKRNSNVTESPAKGTRTRTITESYSGNGFNMSINNSGMLSWDDVDGANGYSVMLTQPNVTKLFEWDVADTYLNLTTEMDGLKYDSGQYTISVAPKGVSGDATMQYYYTSHVDKLESPQNLVWIGDKAAWDAVDGATSYNVSLYDFTGKVVTIPTTSCLYDFSGSSPKDGWTFRVQALSNGTWSAKRNSSVTESPAYETVNEPAYYTVTYDANGGTGTMAAENLIPDTDGFAKTYVFPQCGFTAPSGKEFDKWQWYYNSNPAELNELTPGNSPWIYGNITVKALWKDKAEGNCTVTLYANDGYGTQQIIENVSGVYILPECPFEAPGGYTFSCWAIGSQQGEQKTPGAAINITEDTLIVAIWEDAQHKYTKKPVGGVTSVNESFTINYKLSIQPISIWLQFYNDYQGKWTDNYCMATLPAAADTFTETEVPCIHQNTEESVKWRLAAYLDGTAYYSNEFVIEYVNKVYTTQPESQMVALDTDATINYELNFVPDNVKVEYYVESVQYGNYWEYLCGADADNAVIPGYDMNMARKYRIAASCDGNTFYSRPFTVTWTTGFEVSFDANGGTGSMSAANNQVGQYTLPASTFTAPAGKVFAGWATSANGEIISGETINVTSNTTLYAIWKDIYTLQPVGGTTTKNGTFTISYSLSIQPDSIWLQFYNDYMGEWTDNYCMATMPSSAGSLTQNDVPTLHNDTEETIQWRIAAYKDSMPYYSDVFTVVYEGEPLAPEYLVVYSPTEGNGSTEIDYVEENSVITLYDCFFIPQEGYRFKAWAIGSLYGEQKQPGEQITITGDTYIYAIWEVAPTLLDCIAITATYENGEIEVVVGDDGVQTVVLPKSLVKNGTLPITLKAVEYDSLGNAVPTNVKWKTDASNIAKVTAVKGTTDTAKVTVGKNVDGLAVITATTNDSRKMTSTIEIDVRDFTPRLETNTVTLNTYKTSGESIVLYTAYDAILRDYDTEQAIMLAEDAQILDVNLEGKGSENFAAVYDRENSTIIFSANDVVKNGTYKLTLSTLTAKGITNQTVTVKVANKLPKVTIKQKNTFELFLKNSTAEIAVTAKDPVNTKEEAAITAVAMEGCETFKATAYDTEADSITVSYLEPSDPLSRFVNGKTADTKVNLVVSFDGYRESYIQKNFTIKAKENKITLGQSRTSTKYTALGNDNKPINVINSKTKEVLDLTDCGVIVKSSSTGYVTAVKNGTELILSPILNGEGRFEVNGKKATSHSAKIDVQHQNWLRPVTISHSFKISTTVPTVKLKASTLKLNRAFDTVAETTLVPSVDNCPEFYFTIIPQINKTQTEEEFAKLNVTQEGWTVTAKFCDPTNVPAKGSYKYLLTTTAGGKEINLKLTVSVSEALPSVSLVKPSVKLNKEIREDAVIISPFKVTAGYEITDALITNYKGNLLTAEDIEVTYNSYYSTLTARVKNTSLKNGSYKYSIVPKVKLAGLEYDKEALIKKTLTFTVTVFNGTPSVTYSAKGKIDLAARDTGITYTLTKGTNFTYSAADVNPESFVLTGADKDRFTISYIGKDTKGRHMVEVKARAEALMNKGAKYSYNIAVNIEGLETAAAPAKAFTVSTNQTALKFITKGSTTIYQSYTGTNSFIVDVRTPIGAEMANVEILDTKATTVPNGALEYNISQRPDGSWEVSYKVEKASKIKAKKTYKLALEITPKGNGMNVKPQTLTVNLKVAR